MKRRVAVVALCMFLVCAGGALLSWLFWSQPILAGREPQFPLFGFLLAKQYQAEEDPEAIAYNYLMALIRKDFDLAFGYLSPTLPRYPGTVKVFVEELEQHDLLPTYQMAPCVYVEDVQKRVQYVSVDLRLQYYDPCVKGLEFQNLSSNIIHVRLEPMKGTWKIVDGARYGFYECWSDLGGCK